VIPYLSRALAVTGALAFLSHRVDIYSLYQLVKGIIVMMRQSFRLTAAVREWPRGVLVTLRV